MEQKNRIIVIPKDGVSDENTREIDRLMAGLTERQKSIMQVVGSGSSLKHLHFL